MSYKAIGFDYGGVIHGTSGSFTTPAAELLGVSVEEVRRVFFQNNHLANVEKLPWIDLWKHIAVLLGHAEKLDLMEALIRQYESAQVVNDDMIGLMGRLRTAGYRVGLLSNYGNGLREQLSEQGISDCFDVISISSVISAMKPSAEAFGTFCNELGVVPAELVYIDDTERSLSLSGEIGYTPILFRGYAGLVTRLEELGIII